MDDKNVNQINGCDDGKVDRQEMDVQVSDIDPRNEEVDFVYEN